MTSLWVRPYDAALDPHIVTIIIHIHLSCKHNFPNQHDRKNLKVHKSISCHFLFPPEDLLRSATRIGSNEVSKRILFGLQIEVKLFRVCDFDASGNTQRSEELHPPQCLTQIGTSHYGLMD